MTSEELKNQIVESAEQWAGMHLNALTTIDLLPKNLIEKIEFYAGASSIDLIIGLPYSKEALCKARKELGKGWKRQNVWGDITPTFTYKCYAYKHPKFPNIRVRLDMEMGKVGSTCQLNLVGEKTVPVYEVVCGEQS
jgi:hypothetical protein